MTDEKLNKIISSTEEHLNTLNRFYKDKMYVDTSLPALHNAGEKSNTEDSKLVQGVKKKAPIRSSKPEKTDVASVDIFGNVNVMREKWEFAESLDELNAMIKDCQKCPLHKTRTNFVFGVGNPKADIVVVGEAPGADEDAQGEPFVGRAGQLLNKILEATGFQREEVFILNILKSRPPGNRNPAPDEVKACKPYLDKQLQLINPKLMLLLGKVAAESLLNTREPLNKLRGRTHMYNNWKVRITFHPAALLRNPGWKKDTWEDMKQFKAIYEEIVGKSI